MDVEVEVEGVRESVKIAKKLQPSRTSQVDERGGQSTNTMLTSAAREEVEVEEHQVDVDDNVPTREGREDEV